MVDEARVERAWLDAYVETGDEAAFERIYHAYATMVYSVCLRRLNNRQDAEEAAAACFVVFHRKARTVRKRDKLGAWLYACAMRSAWNEAKMRDRRIAREKEGYAMERMRKDEAADPWTETMLPKVEVAVAALPPDQREAVILHYYRKVPIAEMAVRMGCPEGTAASRLGCAIAKLRKRLRKNGTETDETALVAGLSGSGLLVPAPTSLWRAMQGSVQASSPSSPIQEVAHMTLRDMMLETAGRIVAAAACVTLAMGATLAVAQKATTGSVATKPSMAAAGATTFDTPVWHPDARWERASRAELRERLRPANASPGPVVRGVGGGNYAKMGELDGPWDQMLTRWWTLRPGLFGGLSTGGRYAFMSYDRATDRFHGVTDGATGYLDGPFSRARFMGTDYVPRQSVNEAPSPDGRYAYVLDGPSSGSRRLRYLDFAEQRVGTLPTGSEAPRVLAVDRQGKVYVVNHARQLVILDPARQWQDPTIVPLQVKDGTQWFNAVENSIAVDEVNGRVYACTQRQHWYLWYWDIEDGSFHGLIRVPGKDEPARPGGMGGATPGPFDGVRFYGEGTLGWGPDDPNRRFLYMGQCDDRSFYKLDLEQKIVWAFDPKQGRFVDTGPHRRDGVMFMILPTWFEDGSFVSWSYWKRVR